VRCICGKEDAEDAYPTQPAAWAGEDRGSGVEQIYVVGAAVPAMCAVCGDLMCTSARVRDGMPSFLLHPPPPPPPLAARRALISGRVAGGVLYTYTILDFMP